MLLPNQTHLAYCTNVHPGKDWEETFHSLKTHTLSVKETVCPNSQYAIGLRLSASAANELSDPKTLMQFQNWLEREDCYVFTINGFPHGNFHGTRVKEAVYHPDWSSTERLDYTIKLFDLLVELLPSGVSGSVSSVPGSFKPFNTSDGELAAMHKNLYRVYRHIETLSEKLDIDLHLGLEPEPLCLFETTDETIAFFERFLDQRQDAASVQNRIGVNYDTCHLALEYEDAPTSLAALSNAGIRVSKIHLSSALKVRDFSPATLQLLDSYCEPTYLHQVIAKTNTTQIKRYTDLPDALAARRNGEDLADEWRIHFHIPLHAQPTPPLESTADHLEGAIAYLNEKPNLCQHLEMETYTWAVMPSQLQSKTPVEQIIAEYQHILPKLLGDSQA